MENESHFEAIRHLEAVTMRAWQALELLEYDGWTLSSANGYTGRANSVNPLGKSTLPLEEKIAFSEAWYQARGLPTIYRLNAAMQPQNLEDALAAEGYERYNETAVQTMDLSQLRQSVDERFSQQAQVEDAWLADWGAWNAVPALHISTAKQMLLKTTGVKACYGRIEDKAVGLAMREGDYLGLFDIVVSPEARRQGLGWALVSSLLAWGKQEGAKIAYLQVSCTNSAALALYASLGFEEHHRYWYRRK